MDAGVMTKIIENLAHSLLRVCELCELPHLNTLILLFVYKHDIYTHREGQE